MSCYTISHSTPHADITCLKLHVIIVRKTLSKTGAIRDIIGQLILSFSGEITKGNRMTKRFAEISHQVTWRNHQGYKVMFHSFPTYCFTSDDHQRWDWKKNLSGGECSAWENARTSSHVMFKGRLERRKTNIKIGKDEETCFWLLGRKVPHSSLLVGEEDSRLF